MRGNDITLLWLAHKHKYFTSFLFAKSSSHLPQPSSHLISTVSVCGEFEVPVNALLSENVYLRDLINCPSNAKIRCIQMEELRRHLASSHAILGLLLSAFSNRLTQALRQLYMS